MPGETYEMQANTDESDTIVAPPESQLRYLWSRLLGPEAWHPDGDAVQLGPGQYPGIRRPLRTLWWLVQILLGVGFLLPLLAGLAAIPGLSLISLGMMLDAEARVGRSGRIRDGFPLLAVSTRVGTIGAMLALFLLPIFLLSNVAESQRIVGQMSGLTQNSFGIGKTALQITAFIVLLLAIANGGSFGRFFWPLRKRPTRRQGCVLAAIGFLAFLLAAAQPGFLIIYLLLLVIGATVRNARDLYAGLRSGTYVSAVNDWTAKLTGLFQPWHHVKMAVKGALGALCWLVIPTALLGIASSSPHQNPGPAAVGSFVGGILMVPVAAWLPLLQCHQASTGRFKAIFEVRAVREIICRVPLRWAVATILMYGLAIPLYLSKVVLTPQDAHWLFTPLFILVIYPTRILMGWVYGTGMQSEARATKLIRWPTKLFMIPALGFYSLILFFLPLISEAGPRAMFENHAFLLPVPSGQVSH